MTIEVDAIYRNGMLELQSGVPLREGQPVRVAILAEPETTQDERIAGLHQVLDAWLDQQPTAIFLDPPDHTPEAWAQLNESFAVLLAGIHEYAREFTEAEIRADVETAVLALRRDAPEAGS